MNKEVRRQAKKQFNKISRKYPLIGISILLVAFVLQYYDVFSFVENHDMQQIATSGISLSNCIDGDTAAFIYEGEKVKIRFSGINTPEKNSKKVEPFSEEAAMYTCNKLQEAFAIDVEWDITQSDSYNRKIGIVFVDGENLNFLLLSEGYADLRYLKDTMPYSKEYRKLLAEAQHEHRGRWQNS
ncbi:hypothetical protein AwErysi_09210 [Erysipelotrichaceae bacterium]|nr:hypothetical protein AwErysi_09210 [Erysipelotrichaceae bacterium]